MNDWAQEKMLKSDQNQFSMLSCWLYVYAQPIAYNLLKIVHTSIPLEIDEANRSSSWIVYANKQVYLCNLNSIIDQFIRNNLLGRKFDICRQIMSSS